MTEDIRHRQEHIEFLENYITELTERIEELTEGRDMPKLIRSLEYRINVLNNADGQFNGRITELKSDLDTLQNDYVKIEPILEKLEIERAFYRSLQAEQ